MNTITKLNWDSDFFGFKVGRIDWKEEDEDMSAQILKNGLKESYKLIYYFLPHNVNFTRGILQRFDGKLADEKIIYLCENLEKAESCAYVTLYKGSDTSDILKRLGLISGQFSRYKTDLRFPLGSFERLYLSWVQNSLNGKIADSVYIEKKNDKIRGFMTVKWYREKSIIGLIAVLPEYQGDNVGSTLIKNLKNECIKKGIGSIEVSTQRANLSACQFYIKNNFKEKESINVYHFWIG